MKSGGEAAATKIVDLCGDDTPRASHSSACPGCDRCAAEYSLPCCGPSRCSGYGSYADWDVDAQPPCYELAAEKLREERRRSANIPRFFELAEALGLERCPKCGTSCVQDRREPGDATPLMLSGPPPLHQRYVIEFGGERHCTPFEKLIAEFVALCPACKSSGKRSEALPPSRPTSQEIQDKINFLARRAAGA